MNVPKITQKQANAISAEFQVEFYPSVERPQVVVDGVPMRKRMPEGFNILIEPRAGGAIDIAPYWGINGGIVDKRFMVSPNGTMS